MELATLSLHMLCVCVYSCSLVSGLYMEYTCAFILVVPNEVFGASHNVVFGATSTLRYHGTPQSLARAPSVPESLFLIHLPKDRICPSWECGSYARISPPVSPPDPHWCSPHRTTLSQTMSLSTHPFRGPMAKAPQEEVGRHRELECALRHDLCG